MFKFVSPALQNEDAYDDNTFCRLIDFKLTSYKIHSDLKQSYVILIDHAVL
jgi:hypothetical protein